jgi:3'-phosphoadenosine 5'-phosphosulfate sulfotransferase (PAPS reductase)/FAD synthetase
MINDLCYRKQKTKYKIPYSIINYRVSLSLEMKILYSLKRIREWYYRYGGSVYVSISGGVDSTVLLHLTRSIFSNVLAVFVDTGQEYLDNKNHVKALKNVEILKPKMNKLQIVSKYGYPVVSKEIAQKIHEIRTTKSNKLLHKRLYGDDKGNGKLPDKWMYLIDAPFKISHKCCDILKKRPVKKFEKESSLKPFVGTMLSDSRLRKTNYYKNGCNSFNTIRPMSAPLSIWTKKDIWEYIELNKLEYSDAYKKGCTNTGCFMCMFGVHLEKINRFELLKKIHPKIYDFYMNKKGFCKIYDYITKNNNKRG